MGMENDIFDLFSSVDPEERPKLTFDVNYSYPHSDQFDYEARLERIDYDKESMIFRQEKDLSSLLQKLH